MKHIGEKAKEYALRHAPVLWESQAIICYQAAVEEAQLWVPVEEELPEHRSVVLGKIANLNYPHLFCYDEINSEWYHLDGFEFIGSDLIPTHWRPIERK